MSCDIELAVGAGSGPTEFTTRVVKAPSGGEPSAIFQLDVDELLRERDALESTVLASGVPGRRVVPAHEQHLRRVGQQLFDALFSGHVLGTYRASLGTVRERGEPLRVVLRLTAPQLAALPWEALFDPEIETFICRREPLVRHVEARYTREPLEMTPPLRMLGLVASPRGMQRLDVDAEQERLSEALATASAEGLIELEWLAQASWDGVHERLLSNEWHVLHFIGHGDYDLATDQGLIALVGEDDRAEFVEAERLVDLLNEARPTPRLVVLNSCSSGEQGSKDLFSGTAAVLVRRGINAVAAMQFSVSDPAAIAFARGFYTAIAHGRSIDDASRSGRISMLRRQNSLEWVTPVLYVCGESTQLFSFATPERAGRHQEKPLAPGAPKSAAQTPPPEKRPTITAALLRAMYVEARAEIRAEHDAAAIGLLDDLLSLDPDYRDAAALRDHAVRRRDFADKFQQAIDAQAANDWNTASRLYEQVLEVHPDHRDAAIRREQCEKAQRIIDLQDELRIHAESKNWQAVIDVNDELATLDPDVADPDGLATEASDALRAQAEAAEIEERYKEARADEDAGDWATAISQYRSLDGYRDAEIRMHTCERRQDKAEIAERRRALVDEMTALHEAGRWEAVVATAQELARLDPDNSDPGGIVSDAQAKIREAELADRYAQALNHLDQEQWQQAADLLAAIEQEQPGYRDAAALLKTAQQKLRETAEVPQRATPPPRPLPQTTTPAPPRTPTPPVPVAVQRRWQTSSWFVAIVVIGVALVGGLTILAVVQSSKSSNTSTSTSRSTSTATTSAPSTSAPASGPNETIADYIKKNNIQETTITHGTPGAPTIDLPVPAGWTRIPEGADALYDEIVFNTPSNPNDPPKIKAIVEKLTGNVDTDELLAVAPGELKNLPGYNGGDGQKSTLSGDPAYQLGGSYTKNGVTRMVAQKTVVIQSKDGIYVLQLNAEGPQADGDALKGVSDVIDQKTTITP